MALGRDEILASFHQALGRMVQAIARLDFLVGNWLIALKERGGTDNSALLKPDVSLYDRLQALEKEVKSARPVMLSKYASRSTAWFRRANRLRILRNDFVHARWGVPGTSESTDPVVKYVRMNWKWDSVEENTEVQVAVSELTDLAKETESLADEFHALFVKQTPLGTT